MKMKFKRLYALVLVLYGAYRVFGANARMISLQKYRELNARRGFLPQLAQTCVVRCETTAGCVGAHIGEDSRQCGLLTYETIESTSPGFTLTKMGHCPIGWYGFRGSCYQIPTGSTIWLDAVSGCAAQGSYLATIDSAEESEFIFNLRNSTGLTSQLWIGGHESMGIEGNWQWVNGETWGWDEFSPGQPDNANDNEACLNIRLNSRSWNDVPCTSIFLYLCEQDRYFL